MSEIPKSISVEGPCHDDSGNHADTEIQTTTVQDQTQIYEDLANYEREEEGDEHSLEENPDWSDEDDEDIDESDEEEEKDEKDEQGGIELSTKRSSSTSPSGCASDPARIIRPCTPKGGFESPSKSRPLPPIPIKAKKMPGPNVPKPGPAKLSKGAGLPEWLEEAKQCHYLPEVCMKQLCEQVKECLMEGVCPQLSS
jgi:hypothetical protein